MNNPDENAKILKGRISVVLRGRDLKFWELKPKCTVPFKTFLVPVPFPLVATFETAGTYKKWLWPNSAYITYTWHALLFCFTYIDTYIYIFIT